MAEEGLARVVTGTLHGLSGLRVGVEVDLARGLPGFSLVGLPSAAIRESRERVGAALRHAGFSWPDRRVTVSLAPADVRKDGAAMDLAIATGLLLAAGQLPCPPEALLQRTLIVGELALDATLRPARGVLALGLDAAAMGVDRLLVPAAQAAELNCVPGLRRVPLAHLRDLPRALGQLAHAQAHAQGLAHVPGEVSMSQPGHSRVGAGGPSLRAVIGQASAKRALLIAAAGGHHLALVGPPGCGKSMLARCLPGLLPPLSPSAQLERMRIQSCAGLAVDLHSAPIPPLRAPHHSVSRAGLIGGGRPARPGEATLAHRGVLLLDEAAEFGAEKLDLLREPLGSGEIAVARLDERVSFPARFQLVAATNPCACGYLGSVARPCRCVPSEIARYRRRISGPLRDRIDLWVRMDREPLATLAASPASDPAEAETAQWQQRIAAARQRGAARAHVGRAVPAGGDPGLIELLEDCRPDRAAREALAQAADRMALSLRAVHSTLRVARTIAVLAGDDAVGQRAVLEALSFRQH